MMLDCGGSICSKHRNCTAKAGGAMKLRAMLLVLAATLVFATEKDAYSAQYRAGSLNNIAPAADARQYALEEKARRGMRLGWERIVS